MRLRRLTFAKVILIAVIAAVLIAVDPPTPHWRESVSQSCHLCGNRRVVVSTYQWWRMDAEIIEPATDFAVPAGHVHDWWQYAATYSSYNCSWAADRCSRYRDGRQTWTADSRAASEEPVMDVKQKDR